MSKRLDEDAGTLFDLLADRPDGATPDQVMEMTGWTYRYFARVLKCLRTTLGGNDDTLIVAAQPGGKHQPWTYSLRSGRDAVDPEGTGWTLRRLQAAETTIRTVRGATRAAVLSTDGRTLQGRIARAMDLHIGRALEEVTLIREDDRVATKEGTT